MENGAQLSPTDPLLPLRLFFDTLYVSFLTPSTSYVSKVYTHTAHTSVFGPGMRATLRPNTANSKNPFTC